MVENNKKPDQQRTIALLADTNEKSLSELQRIESSNRRFNIDVEEKMIELQRLQEENNLLRNAQQGTSGTSKRKRLTKFDLDDEPMMTDFNEKDLTINTEDNAINSKNLQKLFQKLCDHQAVTLAKLFQETV